MSFYRPKMPTPLGQLLWYLLVGSITFITIGIFFSDVWWTVSGMVCILTLLGLVLRN